MNNDRELLELAAKAAGYETDHPWNAKRLDMNPPVFGLCIKDVATNWNPLTDDGDALRLVVNLGMVLAVRDEGKTDASVHIEDHPHSWQSFLVEHNDDPYAATRRPIVRAAAEIGKEQK